MSFLRATDKSIEARRLLHVMENEIKELDLPEAALEDLLELYWRVWDLVDGTVHEMELALLPENQSIAITFFPDKKKNDTVVAESAPEYRVPRHEGDPRGTLFLPSVSPDAESE